MAPEFLKRPIILAVDDAPDTLGMLSAVLEKAGLTTLVAADGRGAIILAERVLPDLILMDAVMPQMDGFETVRALKARRHLAHIPIIFMTGLSDTESVVKGFNAGGVDYITKPIVPEEMLARVRVHLANANLAQSARKALDVSGTPLIAAVVEGTVIWVTPEGLKLLGDNNSWRENLAPLLAEIIASKSDTVELRGLGTDAVFASFIGEAQPGEYLLRLRDANAAGEIAILKRVFDLTDREAEVLSWIAKGKSNRDIAVILTCSPRTVNKHLEQIYYKLQVENRTAAAMRAIHVLSQN
jgi:DNA-binding NarL/FixJ family response regulator